MCLYESVRDGILFVSDHFFAVLISGLLAILLGMGIMKFISTPSSGNQHTIQEEELGPVYTITHHHVGKPSDVYKARRRHVHVEFGGSVRFTDLTTGRERVLCGDITFSEDESPKKEEGK
jgi:hypothetical protein